MSVGGMTIVLDCQFNYVHVCMCRLWISGMDSYDWYTILNL